MGDVGILSVDGEESHSFWNYEGAFLEQFTGLFDKNGKEIYEGDVIEDIVPEYCYGAGKKARGIILGGTWAFRIEPINYKGLLSCMGDRQTYSGPYVPESIVIGNIHVNPELLK